MLFTSELKVSMMSDSGGTSGEITPSTVTQIKKEEVHFTDCSPSNSDMYSPSTTVMHDVGVSNTYQHCRLLLIRDRNY